MTFLTELEQNNPKIYMEPQITQNCPSNPEEKEQSWRHNPCKFQTIPQSYSKQNRVILSETYTYRSIEQKRDPRNKPTYY